MTLRATKAPGYVIEPILTEPNRTWEGHHATNPCSIRLSCDPRVFLGYRAGGWDDRYTVDVHEVWASHLGLAILDARGEQVMHRFPLPIFTIERGVPLPQTKEEFDVFQQGPHAADILILHDFRFWEDAGWLYMIYHEGRVTQVFDCIVRMPVATFLENVARSIDLCGPPTEAIRDEWRALWWADGVWEPAGVDGTNRIYPSWANKNDIIFIRLIDGSLRMLHRPVPDVAIVDPGGRTYCPSGADGIADFGVLQTCVRPGRSDNSHIGNNGTPVRAWIGDVPVFVDIVHGVHNRTLCDEEGDGWRLLYLPYLRLLDAATGECLYWSEEPILEADETWREYVEQGEWVRNIPHLDGVMFAGGQLEAVAGKNGLDDMFHFYTGTGDTAVARASFVLRDLLPPEVVDDIEARAAHRSVRAVGGARTALALPECVNGWTWAIVGDPGRRDVLIERTLQCGELVEEASRPIGTRPGYFDADGLFLDGASLRRIDALGWVVVYRGVRWGESGGSKQTAAGLGLLVLDIENPERILYRSTDPIDGTIAAESDWTEGRDPISPADVLERAEDLVPAQVRDEIRRSRERRPMPTDMTRWLRIKAGLENAPE